MTEKKEPVVMRGPGNVHDGETFADAVARLGRDFRQPFVRHPQSRNRVGWKDIPHAAANVFVELGRKVGLYR